MLAKRTHPRYIVSQLPVPAIEALEFLLNKLDPGSSARHLGWLTQRWLNHPGTQPAVLCSMIRYICCVQGETEQAIGARWRLVHWLFSQLPEPAMSSGCTGILVDVIFRKSDDQDFLYLSHPAVALLGAATTDFRQYGRCACALMARACDIFASLDQKDKLSVKRTIRMVLDDLPQHCIAVEDLAQSPDVPPQLRGCLLYTSPSPRDS
eukprot:TRINITY_DN62734_c0_g1_i1.p1 TRINITY_DN62734_c0_g1~~TRINITY_DN62734_c0_g1_i1.p1  ORF type:complete len:208 (-),score=29.46 TRINITY_DN62734_c0_g1_i1:44-667(-)